MPEIKITRRLAEIVRSAIVSGEPLIVEVEGRWVEYYTSSEAQEWLNASHPVFNGERACDLIASGRTAEVMRTLDSLDACAYV